MSDPHDRQVVAAYVGRGRLGIPEGRVRLERVDPDFVADYAAYADCVVCEVPGGGLAALKSLSGISVPTILYDRTADPAVAEAATGLAPTEYVTDAALDDRSLADLIVRVCRRDGDRSAERTSPTSTSTSTSASASATASANPPAADAECALPVPESVEPLLEFGRRCFGLETAAVAITDGTEYTVQIGDVDLAADVGLSETICRTTVRTDGPLELPDTVWGPPDDGLAEPFAALGSYVGDDFPVDGERRGTLWFGSERPRPAFSGDERAFFRLLVRSLRTEIGADEPFEAKTDDLSLDHAFLGDGGARADRAPSTHAEGDGMRSGRGSTDAPTDSEGSTETRFRRLFDRLPDAVVDIELRDGVPIVRGVNDAFEETFGHDGSAAVGTPLCDLVASDARTTDGRPEEHAIRDGYGTAEVERETDEGCRTFLFRGFTYRRNDTERGFGIYTDITDRIGQERRLRVLHRVLRHNLRNEMTAILGYADLLAEKSPTPEFRALAERIYEEATDVSKLGEQVRRIEQALDVDRRRVALDPEPLVSSIAERFRNRHPEATIRISTEATDEIEIVADELLETAIENLLENAIEHHSGEPTVEIRLSPADDGWFDIAVRDDGPGIPERERAVVGGDREITQLDHSLGLGLWVSRWVVRGVGGRLLFGAPETGAEVILRLRRAEGSLPG